MSRSKIFDKKYELELELEKRVPFVNVRVTIINPRTNRITSFNEKCWVDTGFSGGIFVPQLRMSDMELVQITPSITTYTLADGTPVPVYICMGYLTKIENYEIPELGIPITIAMRGNKSYGYLGLEALKHWMAEFDGPNNAFAFLS